MKIFLLAVIFLTGTVELKSLRSLQKRTTVCYDKIGCFSNEGPFHSLARLLSTVPQSPNAIRTMFNLYTRATHTRGQSLDSRHVDTQLDTQWAGFQVRPTKFIIHGFLDNPQVVDWMWEMKDALLIQGDYNVIIVDWSHGNLPPYTQATANTRVVGAEVALLLKQLMSTKDMTVADFHLIGHSLGAHICGYAGDRVPGLERITGFGTKQPSGHADFFPNTGHDQPGCDTDPVTQLTQSGSLMEGSVEIVACNHLRSIKFFTESINTKCPFVAFPCASEDDFYQYHMDVTLKFSHSNQATDESGDITVQVVGDQGTSATVTLNKIPMTFTPGETYQFTIGVPADVGSVRAVTLSWHHRGSLTDPLKWNLFGIRHPKIYVDEIDVYREEAHADVHLCSGAQGLETDNSITINSKCST